MRAIVITTPGGPDVLQLQDRPTPEPSRGEVRVRVRATAVNRADLLQRAGAYPAPAGSPADIPGLEVAGEVDSLGDGACEVAVGDRVFGIVGGGGYAEYIVVPARTLVRIPERLSFVEAAAVPEAFVTAWDAMVSQAHLTAGETVLIHAATSGVGTAGVQLARAIGAQVIGTGRSAAKLARACDLGLTARVVVTDWQFAAEVIRHTGGRGADVVLELVGGAYVAEDLACLASLGRIVVVGLLGGAETELDLGLLMRKRAQIRGTVFAESAARREDCRGPGP